MLKKFLGFGLGLRTNHYNDVIEQKPDVDWFEIISENYMVAGGKPRYYLDQIRENYPIVMHGVSMSIGSTDPLNMEYLTKLKTLIADVQPEWFSDHLCFTSVGGVNSHDLLPLPYTEESLTHVVERIKQVQDFMGRQMLMENVSSYLTYKTDEMNEWQFYREVCEQADCRMLLDINNIYVSARNHDFNAMEYLRSLNPQRVQQFHLAGHSDFGDYVVDTHDHDVPDPVWQLYKEALKLFGPVSTMIERDANIPSFADLTAELNIARNIAEQHIPNIRSQIEV
ncbi:MNIO family bufferin maturase [Thalassotalea montiporae]